jgi:branched-chain amino acid transport system ATP-binding protein
VVPDNGNRKEKDVHTVMEPGLEEREPVLRVDKVSRRFGGLTALSGVDLSLEQSQILGLIGPNGSGKSTLFNVITSIYKPNSGDTYLNGKRITGLAPHKICHLGISRTFQLVKIFSSMTVLENVMVGAVYGRGRNGRNSRKRALEALELVELVHKKDAIAGHMTLSERRLIEVARALSSMPVVALLDEPLAGLDRSESNKMMEMIRKVREERALAILWVEHKVGSIFDLSDRVVVLESGVKIADGTPLEIGSNPRVIEAYLGKSSN